MKYHRRIESAFLLVAILTFACEVVEAGNGDKTLTSESVKNERLIFRSGFEEGVIVKPPLVRGAQWWQQITGSDNGYPWVTNPLRQFSRIFQYLVPPGENIDEYVETRIDEVIGPDGTPTKALYMAVKKYHPRKFGRSWMTRNQLNVRLRPDLKQAYSRYWLKFQPDLQTVMTAQGKKSAWRIIMGWGEATDYFFALYIGRLPDSDLFWFAEGRPPQKKRAWRVENRAVPVPIGEWFLLEVFWKHSLGDDGRLWVAVNEQTTIDYRGRTKLDDRLTNWNIFKVYTGANSLDRGMAYQWIDDVQIYTDIPASRK